jgi:hypothetical protein
MKDKSKMREWVVGLLAIPQAILACAAVLPSSGAISANPSGPVPGTASGVTYGISTGTSVGAAVGSPTGSLPITPVTPSPTSNTHTTPTPPTATTVPVIPTMPPVISPVSTGINVGNLAGSTAAITPPVAPPVSTGVNVGGLIGSTASTVAPHLSGTTPGVINYVLPTPAQVVAGPTNVSTVLSFQSAISTASAVARGSLVPVSILQEATAIGSASAIARGSLVPVSILQGATGLNASLITIRSASEIATHALDIYTYEQSKHRSEGDIAVVASRDRETIQGESRATDQTASDGGPLKNIVNKIDSMDDGTSRTTRSEQVQDHNLPDFNSAPSTSDTQSRVNLQVKADLIPMLPMVTTEPGEKVQALLIALGGGAEAANGSALSKPTGSPANSTHFVSPDKIGQFAGIAASDSTYKLAQADLQEKKYKEFLERLTFAESEKYFDVLKELSVTEFKQFTLWPDLQKNLSERARIVLEKLARFYVESILGGRHASFERRLLESSGEERKKKAQELLVLQNLLHTLDYNDPLIGRLYKLLELMSTNPQNVTILDLRHAKNLSEEDLIAIIRMFPNLKTLVLPLHLELSHTELHSGKKTLIMPRLVEYLNKERPGLKVEYPPAPPLVEREEKEHKELLAKHKGNPSFANEVKLLRALLKSKDPKDYQVVLSRLADQDYAKRSLTLAALEYLGWQTISEFVHWALEQRQSLETTKRLELLIDHNRPVPAEEIRDLLLKYVKENNGRFLTLKENQKALALLRRYFSSVNAQQAKDTIDAVNKLLQNGNLPYVLIYNGDQLTSLADTKTTLSRVYDSVDLRQ